jgi:hypothetical protein
MTDTSNYIETDKEREEGHVDTGVKDYFSFELSAF